MLKTSVVLPPEKGKEMNRYEAQWMEDDARAGDLAAELGERNGWCECERPLNDDGLCIRESCDVVAVAQ